MENRRLTENIKVLDGSSKFKTNFSNEGGLIKFSNTSGKWFALSIESVLQCFKDILANPADISVLLNYDESEWRTLTARIFTDDVANAMSTVQSKPMFVMLSKIYCITNSDEDAFTESSFFLEPHKIETTIDILGNLSDSFTIHEDRFNAETVLYANETIRKIIYLASKYCIEHYGFNFIIQQSHLKIKDINSIPFVALSIDKFLGTNTFIGKFNGIQSQENLTTSNTSRFYSEILRNENDEDFYYLTTQWVENASGQNMSLNNFNDLLSEWSSGKLVIKKSGEEFQLVISNQSFLNSNIIFYGAPGTGKSHKVSELIKERKYGPTQYKRVTFHPEYDYASFVGGYKPVTEKDGEGKEFVAYKFSPEVFTDIYVQAWLNPEREYLLAIEEINRGNCAQIFGDIFQLLDRSDDYAVTPSADLSYYLGLQLKDNPGFSGGKMRMPDNLSLVATMNTSDQSLLPMDSAFKRRWKWEYVPISYEEDMEKNPSASFVIKVGEQKYSWLSFIKAVNKQIKENPNLGMDKCLGNYFVKPEREDSQEISMDAFINKVVFYLWSDVFRDEDTSIFGKRKYYEDFFPVSGEGIAGIEEMFNILELSSIPADQTNVAADETPVDSENSTPAVS